jgi:dienelactone hydrolase
MTARLALMLSPAGAVQPATPLYPDRGNLLVLRNSDGREQPVRKRSQWERRREHILANMQKVMGPLPGGAQRVPLDVRIEREERGEGYLRKKISYASAPGERVPAYLLIPEGRQGRVPAVLCLHQTVRIGKDEPVGLGGSGNLRYADELARRGYVVLAPDYPGFGEHTIDVYARGWASGSMKAVWDNIRGVDLLRSLPEVDRGRIGCMGHSLGGHNTLFTGAFDTRIRALVSNCGFTAFGKYYGGNIAGWAGRAYMPRIRTDYPTPERMPFDFHEVVAALAPRAFLAIAPIRDDNFEVSGVRDVMAAARPVYRLFGRPERLSALYPDCGHDWPPDTREAAYRWLDRWLK